MRYGQRVEHYFGVKWDAPAFENAIEVVTPVGQVCFLCGEPVEEGESGLLGAVYDAGGVRVAPQHIECFLRSVLGCVQHLEERCTCFGGEIDEKEITRPYREQARETMEWLILHS